MLKRTVFNICVSVELGRIRGKRGVTVTDGEIVDVCKLYGRGRVQIPSEIRKELQLVDGDKICWKIDPLGRYYIEKAQSKRGGGRYTKDV